MFFERGSFQSEHAVCLKRDSLLFKQTLVHFTYAGFKGNNETNTHFRKQHVHHVPLRKQYSCKQSPVVSTNTFSFKLFIPCTILKTLKKHVMKWLKKVVCLPVCQLHRIYINISYISISNGAGFLYVSLNSMNLMTGPLLPFKYAAFLEKMKSFLKELGFEKCSSC